MEAIILNEFGDTDKLVYTQLDLPKNSEDEVLIEVKAISINPVDVRTRAGSAMADYLKQYKPLILGWDIAGVVVKTGGQASTFKTGDRVFGLINFLGHGKGYAEFVAAPHQHIALIPDAVSFEQAAPATLAALTAWQLLHHFARIGPGSRVLIQAASGGVGHYAVQIAKYLGAYVIGTSSAKNRDFVLGLGADQHIAYDEQAFEDVVKEADVVLDAFSGDHLFRSLKAVREGGTLISLLPFISEELLLKAKEKNVTVHYSLVKSSGEDMKEIAALLKTGSLKSYVSKTFSFQQMALAHQEMETGKTVGKIVVRL